MTNGTETAGDVGHNNSRRCSAWK